MFLKKMFFRGWMEGGRYFISLAYEYSDGGFVTFPFYFIVFIVQRGDDCHCHGRAKDAR